MTRRHKSRGLFYGWWTAPDGRFLLGVRLVDAPEPERIGRATRGEIREAYRLWGKHADIRAGRRAA
jgi:hypothetical protein